MEDVVKKETRALCKRLILNDLAQWNGEAAQKIYHIVTHNKETRANGCQKPLYQEA